MSSTVDQLLDPLTDRTAFLHDAQYHADVHLLRDCLMEIEASLTKTGVDAATRTTILTVLLKGFPRTDVARQRMADREEKVRELMTQPPRPIFVNVNPYGCQGCGNPYTVAQADGRCVACADD